MLVKPFALADCRGKVFRESVLDFGSRVCSVMYMRVSPYVLWH